MTNELPAIASNKEIIFTRLGLNEDIDMTIDLESRRMTFERVFWNEEKEEWEGKQAYLEEIEDELKDYGFLKITRNPLSIQKLKTFFSFKMFIKF